uniref:Probable serine hydrolase n=1 Tax=Caligus rogercresseyi TaxID=217165 RepID=C1BPR6_CALRO|nr:Probable serine hydrolase [Caligus rogercresseyi]
MNMMLQGLLPVVRRISSGVPSLYRKMSSSSYVPKEISIPVHWGEVRGRLWEEEDATSGPKKTIFGIHGWLDNAGTMNGIGPHLPPGYKFYVFDQPGCGLSSSNADAWGYNYNHHLIWIRHLKELLGLEREKTSLIAFSLGSLFAQSYACSFPSDIDRIVQMDLIYAPVLPIESIFQGYKMYVQGALRINRHILSTEKSPPEFSLEEATKVYHSAISERNGENALTEESVRILMERGMMEMPNGKYRWRHDPRQAIPPPNTITQDLMHHTALTLKCPLLLIKASDFMLYLHPKHAESFLSFQREHNPHFRYEEIQGGHYAHLNYPERVLPLIRDFLSESFETETA